MNEYERKRLRMKCSPTLRLSILEDRPSDDIGRFRNRNKCSEDRSLRHSRNLQLNHFKYEILINNGFELHH